MKYSTYFQEVLCKLKSHVAECEDICLSNCFCTAYAYLHGRICPLWFWELPKVVTKSSGQWSYSLYVNMAKRENSKPHSNSWIEIIVLLVIGVLTLMLVSLVLWWRSKRKLFIKRHVNSSNGLTIFSNAQMKNATRNFSEKLGEGGFGSVFKGTVRGTSMVVVKKLKGLGQGEKQFRAEVQTIGMIQHINLVRLFGYCAEGSKRLLVYEYMENGSLNSHLFSKSSIKLIWEIWYRIALGTARGLAYLHEECKDCIIHCDMKPDNVLLDADFCPKIADFGMAKLLGRDFIRALTTMRGTIRYLAPEWISGLPITRKSDVYSYGMMLLEIISGRRNSEKIKEGNLPPFPSLLH
uniref:non-specific serine/threonine protein kinase n=1 Tax=Aegilops tauschii subsp. strangulata TaxID=200361 RepID=A0A453GMJ9_AEGTS